MGKEAKRQTQVVVFEVTVSRARPMNYWDIKRSITKLATSKSDIDGYGQTVTAKEAQNRNK